MPKVLYSVMNSVTSFIPKPGISGKGIYAPNPESPLTKSIVGLVEQVQNHLSATELPSIEAQYSQWPSPFLTLFSEKEDAENFLKSQGEKPGDREWLIYEVSGDELIAAKSKVLSMKTIRQLGTYKNQYIIWESIPRRALIAMWEWRMESE